MLSAHLSDLKSLYKAYGAVGVPLFLRRKFFPHQQGNSGSYWVGKAMELTGNIVTIDDCHFDLDDPEIPTAVKSLFWGEHWERAERESVKKYLNPALPVIELGGAMGVVACMTNNLLHHPRKHIVVEANTRLITLLERNREANQCEFTVINRSLAYDVEDVEFYLAEDIVSSSSIYTENASKITVPSVTLEEIADTFAFERFSLICDIEGHEISLIANEIELLAERAATIIVEFHHSLTGNDRVKAALQSLVRHGLGLCDMIDSTYTFKNTRWQ